MTDDTPDHDNARHHEKMAKKKAARDKIMAGKTIEKGLLIVHTGKGKGKSTAAFGMVFRCVGHGMKSGVIQFVKGAWGTGERTVLEKFPDLVTINARHQRCLQRAHEGLEAAQALLAATQPPELVAEELRSALQAVGDVVGQTDPEELLGVIFGRFCIGK